jgi:hypothetical protein
MTLPRPLKKMTARATAAIEAHRARFQELHYADLDEKKNPPSRRIAPDFRSFIMPI